MSGNSQCNCEVCPNDMTAHYGFFSSPGIDADIVVLTETKLGDPPAMYPPCKGFGYYPLHVPAREPVQSSTFLRGSNSGGVTILVHERLGIVPSIGSVVYDHYTP